MARSAEESTRDRGSLRLPVAAGYFYPAHRNELIGQIEWCFAHPLGPGAPSRKPAPAPLAVISPHAGLPYSGPFAAHAFHDVGAPKTVIVVGPNHYGRGQPVALAPHAVWRTPLGDTPTDDEVGRALAEMLPGLCPDATAHAMEHSIELQLVFLQYVLGDTFRLVAVAVRDHALTTATALAETLVALARDREVLLVASTDMTHYEPDEVARRRDRLAIESMERLDVAGLAMRLAREEATLCGPGPALAVLAAARGLGASRARLLCQGTSGDTGGNRSSVVGYAALRVDRDQSG